VHSPTPSLTRLQRGTPSKSRTPLTPGKPRMTIETRACNTAEAGACMPRMAGIKGSIFTIIVRQLPGSAAPCVLMDSSTAEPLRVQQLDRPRVRPRRSHPPMPDIRIRWVEGMRRRGNEAGLRNCGGSCVAITHGKYRSQGCSCGCSEIVVRFDDVVSLIRLSFGIWRVCRADGRVF
jgi:hypothetical protein